MITRSNPAAVHRRFQTVGSALMRVNFNNTHSGNMSCRDPLDVGRFWITASGSACGDLSAADLVSVRFGDLSYEGPARPSSEANTHRRVLELPGATACVHCHAIASTLIGFEAPQPSAFLIQPDATDPDPRASLFQPVDVWGAGLIGAVTVGIYHKAVGSSEMEERISAYLRQAPLTIVKGHGPFACGQSLEHCLHYIGVMENSATIAIALRRRGVDIATLQHAIRSAGAPAIFAWTPRRLEGSDRFPEPAAEAAFRCEFRDWLSYNFDLGLGAFGTGSMSRRISPDEMIFCPMSAAPQGIEVPLQRVSLHPTGPEAADVRVHRRIYADTSFKACMMASSPLATAEAMAALAAADGVQSLADPPEPRPRPAETCPAVIPIDAEAAHYKIRLPVARFHALADDAVPNLVSSLMRIGNGCCLIAGYGVIAAGEERLAQAAYRVSLAERVARFRLEVDLNHRALGGPAVAALE